MDTEGESSPSSSKVDVSKISHWDPHTQEQFSVLSSKSTKVVSYKGLLNLGIMVLVFSNLRLVMENFFRYGLIVGFSLPQGITQDPYKAPGLFILSSLFLYAIIALVIEKIAFKLNLSKTVVFTLHAVNLVAEISIPTYMVNHFKPMFGVNVVISLWVAAYWLKLYSYAHTNYMLRTKYLEDKQKKEDTDKQDYPRNLNIKDMLYFMAIPTLCYQTRYPKRKNINYNLLFRRIVMFIVLAIIVYIISHQYIYPAVVNSIQFIDNHDVPKLLERLLKTSVPNLYVWLLGFYVFFEVYLNILSDLTKFGDTKFFGDWWNAQSLGYYWRTWNLPVHNWMLRHVYIPMSKRGYSREIIVFTCFLISAFFHEYVLAVPFGQIKGWAFFGMLAQVPLIKITDTFKKKHYVGNIIFWCSIVLGQPFLIFMYYRDYLQQNPH
eukprot:TRINITY_DN3921_c0_g2_i2.p1 TRINITY_DN3921_c0_g2~~TRINITY_DN3921_c0_g2_i2.p1  ORF type:complete len:434 (-),score=42.01 TRINITY_DN3921_c0_g2_i2:92-1393(-)